MVGKFRRNDPSRFQPPFSGRETEQVVEPDFGPVGREGGLPVAQHLSRSGHRLDFRSVRSGVEISAEERGEAQTSDFPGDELGLHPNAKKRTLALSYALMERY